MNDVDGITVERLGDCRTMAHAYGRTALAAQFAFDARRDKVHAADRRTGARNDNAAVAARHKGLVERSGNLLCAADGIGAHWGKRVRNRENGQGHLLDWLLAWARSNSRSC
jgi:hypothetical protein